MLALARTVIDARVAQRQGDKAAAMERFERAAALQDGLPYMAPYWSYPVRHPLAVALIQAGRLDGAEEQFKRALNRAPANGWSWYRLAELYQARGKADQAGKLEADLAKCDSATSSSSTCQGCDRRSAGARRRRYRRRSTSATLSL